MLSRFLSNKKYVIIALIGLIGLLYLLKPKTEFESCYKKCTELSYYPVDGECGYSKYLRGNSCYINDSVCLVTCANTK